MITADKFTSHDYDLDEEIDRKISSMRKSLSAIDSDINNSRYDLSYYAEGHGTCSTAMFDAKTRFDAIKDAIGELSELHTQMLELIPMLERAEANARQDVLDTCKAWEEIRKELE